MNDAKIILQNMFGHNRFRGNQEEIINSIIQGNNALVLMPTGGGKSLCYQIPAIARKGTAIVISPLIALMKDQVDALNEKGIEAAFLNSSISHAEQKHVENSVLQGHIKILYVSPERAMTPYFQTFMCNIEVSLIAIDEAHCVSQWGHDFRPEYMELQNLVARFNNIPRIALTATAGEATRKEILKCLDLESAPTYISSFDRPNIKYSIQKKGTKPQNILNLIKFIKENHENDSGIVYCLSRKSTEEVAAELVRAGLKAMPYHAKLSQAYKEKTQEKFLQAPKSIIVATIAFGMGIDKPDVRFVAHMDLPKCLESYYQETGRAGRDGLPSNAWMLYGLRDLVLLKRMGTKGVSSAARRRVHEEKLDAILGLCETTKCRREVLLNYFDDKYKGPCENCDNCLAPVTSKINATSLSIIALTCVYETKQKFNIHHMIDVLMGNATLAVQRNEHNTLKIFAAGKNQAEPLWYSVYRQLIALGHLKMIMDGKSELKLTESALRVIEGDEEVWLRKDYKKTITAPSVPKQKKVRKKAVKKKVQAPLPLFTGTSNDSDLFIRLKEFRKEVAKKKRTKVFKVFPDKTLKEMSIKRPKELYELEDIYGVGPKKLKKFGKLFLKAIQDLS